MDQDDEIKALEDKIDNLVKEGEEFADDISEMVSDAQWEVESALESLQTRIAERLKEFKVGYGR